jgi:hypothetical protein
LFRAALPVASHHRGIIMNYRILSLGVVALALASTAAFADVHLNVDLNPFGWGAPPPVVYESPRYYAPPPVVYNGRGHWGEQRAERGRGRSDHHDEGHHDDGDRRR